MNIPPTIIALDLEGTLIATVGMPVPRPGLYRFLEFCHERFERVVLFTAVPEDQFRQIAKQLVQTHHAPDWFPTVEYISWDGEKKNLSWIPRSIPEEVLLLDDFGCFIVEQQRQQWIEIDTFDAPFPKDDQEFDRVMKLLTQRLQR